jgi:hypothetical protein
MDLTQVAGMHKGQVSLSLSPKQKQKKQKKTHLGKKERRCSLFFFFKRLVFPEAVIFFFSARGKFLKAIVSSLTHFFF